MNVQDEIKALKERIVELEEQAKEEQEFPQDGDKYWYLSSDGYILNCYKDDIDGIEVGLLEIGNMFKTEEQAEFAVEKLKVEAELRKFSRPFEEDKDNYFMVFALRPKTILIDSDEDLQTHGTVYFETIVVAFQAIEAVGEERIKKYIFGVED